jgi:thymidylate synthase
VFGANRMAVRHLDQLQTLINGINKDPYGRRHILSAWNPGELELMALPPCHVMSQFYVGSSGKLSCHMYQRSADMFLGVPFNIASYALLTHMVAQVCNLSVGELIISFGDAHIYDNHLEQVREQLSREPLVLPILDLDKSILDITKFTMQDVKLVDYNCYATIKAPMAV